MTDPSRDVDRVDSFGHNFLDIARDVNPGQWQQAWLIITILLFLLSSRLKVSLDQAKHRTWTGQGSKILSKSTPKASLYESEKRETQKVKE